MLLETLEGIKFEGKPEVIGRVCHLEPSLFYFAKGRIFPAALKMHSFGLPLNILYPLKFPFVVNRGVTTYKGYKFDGFVVASFVNGFERYVVDSLGDYYLGQDLVITTTSSPICIRMRRCS